MFKDLYEADLKKFDFIVGEMEAIAKENEENEEEETEVEASNKDEL